MRTNYKIDSKRNVSDIVRDHYQTADVFRKLGINYCCAGNFSLEEICKLKQLNLPAILEELERSLVRLHSPAPTDLQNWPPDFLMDYMVYVHHAYMNRAGLELLTALMNFSSGHLSKYPYMQEVAGLFEELFFELKEQCETKEQRLFPYLKQIYSTYKKKETYGGLFVRTLGRSILGAVEREQQRVAIYLDQLRTRTNFYSFDPIVCTNHQVLYKKLEEFDHHLAYYNYLEHHLLLPKMQLMEKELLLQ